MSNAKAIRERNAALKAQFRQQAGGIVNTPKITYSKTDTQAEEKNQGGFLGGLGYLGHKLGLGVVQGIEGISDFIVGGVADLFGADEFADNMLKNDWTNYSAAEEWFNPGEGWQFAGDVAQGVGGMLPAIAVTAGITVASGGTAVPLAAQIAGSTVFGLQAAGQSTSEAAKESGTAGGKEWLYGIGSGALETGIEALSGGIGGTQAGKVLGKQLGKSTLGKVATSFVSEGLEEVASDLLNPALKRVTGVDKEAKVDWGNIPRTFLVGGAIGAVMGGAGRVKNAVKAGGFNNLNAAENAQQLNERLADNNVRQAEGKKLTYTQEDINSVRDRLAKNLQKMSADKRQAFMEQNNLGNVFNEDGSAKPITLAPESYNKDSYSASLKGREGSFVFKPVSMDSEASTAAKKAMNSLTKLTKGDVNIVLTEDAITTESGAKANGLYKDGIIYLDAKADNYEQIKIVGSHEVVHSLEGTKAYNALANYVAETISKDPALQEKYGYEKYRTVYDSILEGDWTETTKDYQAMTEIFADYIAKEVLVNEDSLRRVSNRDANILVKLYEWVRDSIKRLGNTESELESKRSLRKMERLLSTALNESRGGVSLETIEKNAREAERTKEQEKTAEISSTGKLSTVRYNVDTNVFEIGKNSELAKRIQNSTESKYKVIKRYLTEKFGNTEFTLSDGKKAIMDNSDAEKLKSKANDIRVAELNDLKKLVEKASLLQDNIPIDHPKFDAMSYYIIKVSYDGDIFDIVINVGRAKNDGSYHVYTIVNYNKKRFAGQMLGLSGPVGNRTKNESFNTIIRENFEKSTQNAKKVEKTSTSRSSLNVDSEGNSLTEEQTILNAMKDAGFDTRNLNEEGQSYYNSLKAGGVKNLQKNIEYLDAVRRERLVTAKKMVKEAAEDAGYKSPLLYHGTASFGFTEIKTSGVVDGAEWSPFFATNNPNVATTYSNAWGERRIGKVKKSVPQKSYDQLWNKTVSYLSNGSGEAGEVTKRNWKSILKKYGDQMSAEQVEKISSGNFEGFFATNESGVQLVPLEEGFTWSDYIREGNYGLYANTDNFLDVEGNGAQWDNIDSKYGKTTREIALEAKRLGYSGVKVKDVIDRASGTHEMLEGMREKDFVSDIYIFFEPQAQVKSADPVTYDDNGDIIPLTERFKKTNKDIRYSIDVDKYTEKQYNDFGWARINNVLTARENADFKAKYAKIKSGQLRANRTKNGEIIVAVNDGKDGAFGVNNTLVYAKGTIDNYKITKVVKINLNDETSIDIVRGYIYESKGIIDTDYFDGLLEEYDAKDFQYGPQRTGSRTGSKSYSRSQDGRRTAEKTSRYSIDVNSPKAQREAAWSQALSRYVHRIQLSADMKATIINQVGKERAKRLFDVWENKSNNGLDVVTVHKELERDGFSTYAAYIEDFLMDMDSTFSRIAPKLYKAAESGKEVETQETQRREKKGTAKPSDEVELAGLQAQQMAKYTKKKVYSKQDAEIITNDLLNGYMNYEDEVGSLSGRNRKQVVQMLWEGMNKAAPGQKAKIATKVADYLIQHTVMENIRSDSIMQMHSDTIDALTPYLHKLNLDNIKEDLKYHFGNNSPYLRWGKRKGEKGIGIDVAAMELSEKGYYIEAVNNVDIFLHINELYQNAIDGIKQTSKRFVNEVLDEESQKALKQDVAKAVLNAFDSHGTDSELTKLLHEYDTRVQNWKEKYYEERDRNYHTSSVLYKVQQLKDVERGTFANASEFKNDIFKKSIGLLSRIKYRGNLNKSGTRRILGSLLEWYVPENPMLTEGVYNEEVAKMLMQLADNMKPLTAEQYDLLAELEEKSGFRSFDKLKEWYTRENVGNQYSKIVKSWLNTLADPTEFTVAELRSLENVVDYFKRFIESYNKVYRNGKLVEAVPLAEKYIKQLQRRKRTKIGWLRKPFEKYMQAFADPMTVARYYDGYEDGFFSESLDALRKGAISAVEMEQALQEPLEKFYQKNKKFLQDSYDRTIEYQGEQISVQQAMLLYMTLKREQAIKGLAYSGFKLRREDVTVSIKGFATEENLDIDTLRMQALQEQETIFQQLNEAEREYISIVEKIFNEDCKKAKSETDILRQGYTNISDGYYVPIRRASIAQNVEKWTYKDELATISDFSFNKDTVAGAKNQLFIDSLTDVLTKHIGGISQYSSLALVLDSYNILFNLNISGNPNVAVNVKSESENVWAEGGRYFSELIDDIKGVSKSKGSGQKFVKTLRSGYAKYQLGANPKVWLTQLSSFAAATNILNPSSLISGFGIKVEGDVLDQYCPLAKIRNSENSAALAQGVIEKTGKIGDVLMKPIGAVDRWVIKRLFGACQIEVAKNGGPKRGTQENLTKAGELLTKVILETQQNALATERSAAMRSGNEIMKSFTMFSADSMKVLGRVVDAVGESTVLRAKIRVEADSQIKGELKKRLSSANKKAAKAISALVVSALFMASVALGFKWLYNKDDKDEDIVKNLTVDAIGNLFGGLPFIRDVYSFFSDGYEVQNFAYVAFNDLLDSATIVKDLSNTLIEGKEIDRRELILSVRKLTYASGQILGIPTRNMYNVAYGLTKRVSPETAYKWNDAFYKSSYKSDLAKAIENEDDEMMATIVGLMLNENVGGIEDETTRKVMDTLITSGHNIIPKAVPDKLTYKEDEETVEISLTKKQKDSFAELYFKANEAAARMVKSVQFNKLGQEEQAAAMKLLYDAYYNLAVDDCLERDSTQKNVLFMSAFDPATLATIIVKLKSIEADKDKFGRSVSGSRKEKVIKYIESLRLSAAQKYMILGYFGYKNTKGTEVVRKYINGLKISAKEKEILYTYCGY